MGNLKTIKDPFDKITTYDYYSNGLLQSITTPDDDNIGAGITVYTYYPDGMLQTVTDAVYNNTTTFGYDDFDHLRTITDAALKTTTIYCDAAGNVTGVIDPLCLKDISYITSVKEQGVRESRSLGHNLMIVTLKGNYSFFKS